MAAKHGHVHALQFLYEHGCVGDERTAITAAQNGRLSALQILRSRGCPYVLGLRTSLATRLQAEVCF
jgi:hypothetical protein